MSRLILVPFDQLSLDRGAMRDADPSSDEILMVESQAMITSRPWHAQRLHLVLSSAAHHAEALRVRGFTVHAVSAATVVDGLARVRADRAGASVLATAPRSRPLQDALASAGVTLIPDDSFLTPRADFASWSAGRLPVMETFYRQQRARLRILMDGDGPVGGRWNFDADNRLPPPKSAHPWPDPLQHPIDDLDRQVWAGILDRGLPVVGGAAGRHLGHDP